MSVVDTRNAQYKQEARRVRRIFQGYTSETRAMHAASHRLGHRQRGAVGEYFYVHPERPDVCFPTRKAAVLAGLAAQAEREASVIRVRPRRRRR